MKLNRIIPLVLAPLCLLPTLAAGQSAPPSAPLPDLSDAERVRLTDAASDQTLLPWQRDLMLQLAGNGAAETTRESSPGLLNEIQPPIGTTVADGNWTAVPPPPPSAGWTAVYDPMRDRMLVFGGARENLPRAEVWTLTLAGSPVWSLLNPAGAKPSPRYWHTAIYDPVRDRMLIFGGLGPGFFVSMNDTWALSLSGSPSWSALAPSGGPPPARYAHSAFYDFFRDRVVVFGGYSGSNYLNDVWTLSLAGPAWSQLAPAGSPPAGRGQHSAIYDPVRDRMVIFGGSNNGGNRNDVWSLSFAGSGAWTALAPSGTPPAPRRGHAAVYDQARDRMVLHGGDSNVGFVSDAWSLSLAGSTAWSMLAPIGTGPSVRHSSAAFYDPVRDRMVVFSGVTVVGGVASLSNDVWALFLPGITSWSSILPGSTAPRSCSEHSAIFDAERDRMVTFGGVSDNADTWAFSFSGGAWSKLATQGITPIARTGHTAIYDPPRQRMVVFGGNDFATGYRNDVWALSLAGTPVWSEITPTGVQPPGRFRHSAIYDPVRDRMVVFGGSGGSNLNDVWALLLAGTPGWIVVTPAGTPPLARQGHSAIYDTVRDRMVVFGGSNGAYQNDTWALSFAGSPNWSQLTPAGSPPPARYEHRAIYDPVRDRMVMFAGRAAGFYSDTWSLSLSGSTAWSALTPGGGPPPARFGHSAIHDPSRDRAVFMGGSDGTNVLDDVWTLAWGTSVSVPRDGMIAGGRFELAAPWPNPSGTETIVAYELAQPSRVVVDVFDIHGRRLKGLADAWTTAGSHEIRWGGDDDRGVSVRPGVYFVRMQSGAFQATRRIARIR